MDELPVNDENCDINPSPTPEDVDEESCQFLKCIPKENPPPSYHDPLLNSKDIPKHVSLRRTPNSQIHSNGDQDCRENKIFAKQNENGSWLLRWDVEQQTEEDFIALCYEGSTSINEDDWEASTTLETDDEDNWDTESSKSEESYEN